MQAALTKHFPLFPDERYDSRSGPHGFSVGFHSDYGTEAILRIEAAHISNLTGRSYASTYKVLRNHDVGRPSPRRRDLALSHRGKVARATVMDAVATKRDHLDERLDYFLIDHTALACVHNLDCAEYLANLGCLSESAAVMRQALEKIALLAELLEKGEKFDFFSGMKAVWNVRYLKGEFPTAGKLYSLLSAYAHWSPVMHFDVLGNMGKYVGVMKASPPFKATALILLSTIHLMLLRLSRQCISQMIDDIEPITAIKNVERGLIRSGEAALKTILRRSTKPALWSESALFFLSAAGKL